MKLKIGPFFFLFAMLFFSESAFASNYQAILNGNETGAKDSVQAINHSAQPKTPFYRSGREEESIYYIDIKEKRDDDNFITRKILSGYTNKSLRSVLYDWSIHFPKPLNEFYILVIEKAFRFPVVFFFLFIIIALAVNVLLVIGILFLTNKIMNYRDRRAKELRLTYEKILTDLMLQVIDTKQAISILSKRRYRKNYNLLIEVLMDFQKSFRGDSDRQIIELYQEMDLGRISYNKTFAISFYQQVKGIRELTNMHPYHATEIIASHLNDPNDIVRTEAQICYPHVNKEAPFDFLDILEKPFSQWAQLNIYYFIKIHEMAVPSFDKWLKSNHPNVVRFCILMIALFQQQENSSEVIRLLHDPREEIRRQAIKTCGVLQLFESKEALKEIFQTETHTNQLEITITFQHIGDETDIPFLEAIVRSEKVSLRLEACHTLYNLSENGRNHLEDLNQSMNFVLSPYIAHIKDPRN